MGGLSEGNVTSLGKSFPATADNETRGLGNSLGVGGVARLGSWLPLSFSAKSSALACDQVVKLLPDYASNSLSATRRAQVEEHLKKCPFCAEKLRAIRAAQSVVRDSVVDRMVTPVKRFRALRAAPNRLCQSRDIT